MYDMTLSLELGVRGETSWEGPWCWEALVGCGGGVSVSDETAVWEEGDEMDSSELNHMRTSGGR